MGALDHIDIGGSAGAYETLLGRRCAKARLQTENVGLRFGADRPSLSSLAFAVEDVTAAARLLERRGVPTTRTERLQLSEAATHGVPIVLVESSSKAVPSPAIGDEAAAISSLDHVVIRSPNPERAVALYG